jgi:hypothetical protein
MRRAFETDQPSQATAVDATDFVDLHARVSRWRAVFGEPTGPDLANPDNEMIYLLRDIERALIEAAACRALAERAYGVLWRNVIGGDKKLYHDARVELMAAIGRDGQRRGIAWAVQTYGEVSKAEILRGGA